MIRDQHSYELGDTPCQASSGTPRLTRRGLHEVHDIWAQTYRDIPVASAQQASVIAEIRAGFINGFEEAMRLALSILTETDSTGMEG